MGRSAMFFAAAVAVFVTASAAAGYDPILVYRLEKVSSREALPGNIGIQLYPTKNQGHLSYVSRLVFFVGEPPSLIDQFLNQGRVIKQHCQHDSAVGKANLTEEYRKSLTLDFHAFLAKNTDHFCRVEVSATYDKGGYQVNPQLSVHSHKNGVALFEGDLGSADELLWLLKKYAPLRRGISARRVRFSILHACYPFYMQNCDLIKIEVVDNCTVLTYNVYIKLKPDTPADGTAFIFKIDMKAVNGSNKFLPSAIFLPGANIRLKLMNFAQLTGTPLPVLFSAVKPRPPTGLKPLWCPGAGSSLRSNNKGV